MFKSNFRDLTSRPFGKVKKRNLIKKFNLTILQRTFQNLIDETMKEEGDDISDDDQSSKSEQPLTPKEKAPHPKKKKVKIKTFTDISEIRRMRLRRHSTMINPESDIAKTMVKKL